MTEQKLEVKVNGQYNNIDLKSLEPNNSVTVEKVFAEGYKLESKTYKKKDGSPSLYFSCKVKYEGKDCTFFLNENQHESYKVQGGIGDKVRIDCSLKKDKKGAFRQVFNFTKVA